MRLTTKDIIYIIIIILLSLGAYKLSDYLNKKKIEEKATELREYRIKNNTLVKISEGYYSKLVADTLTKKELREKVRSLELEVENPIIVEVIKFVPKEIDTEIGEVEVLNDTIRQTDYYPQKEDYYVKYSSKTNIKTEKGVGNFSFQPQEFKLAIGQKEDGTYEVKTRLPEYFEITGLDVQALPMTPKKKDNFGILLGGGYGQNLTTKEEFLNIQAGVRYKKTYFFLNGGTNNTLNGTLTFEL